MWWLLLLPVLAGASATEDCLRFARSALLLAETGEPVAWAEVFNRTHHHVFVDVSGCSPAQAPALWEEADRTVDRLARALVVVKNLRGADRRTLNALHRRLDRSKPGSWVPPSRQHVVVLMMQVDGPVGAQVTLPVRAQEREGRDLMMGEWSRPELLRDEQGGRHLFNPEALLSRIETVRFVSGGGVGEGPRCAVWETPLPTPPADRGGLWLLGLVGAVGVIVWGRGWFVARKPRAPSPVQPLPKSPPDATRAASQARRRRQ
jgi:hypothetical protein